MVLSVGIRLVDGQFRVLESCRPVIALPKKEGDRASVDFP